MGFNLSIGEAFVDADLDERWCRIAVKPQEIADAPINSADDQSNCVSPSYTQWHEFCVSVGLVSVFYAGKNDREQPDGRHPWWKDSNGDEHEGLLYSHPGAAALTEDHYKEFFEARLRHRSGAEEYTGKRLDWLVWWTRWALDNCKYPTFCNS